MPRKKSIMNTLVAIQSSEYDKIEFKTMEHDELEDDGETVFRETSLFICVHSHGDLMSFHFENASEAHTFAKRMLEAAEGFLPC